ncbi:uncharacterized protein [Palaemon carinicauda]|uniref:uncharacterized protein n=1 Tax=Palaemon carinicauda TaxID=392227 RepID=UPI0035B59AB4
MKNMDQEISDPRIDLVLIALIHQATMESQGTPGDGNAMGVLLNLLQNLLSQSGIEAPRNLERVVERTHRRQERRRRRRREAVSRHAYPTSDYQALPGTGSGPVSDEVDLSRTSSGASSVQRSTGNSCTMQEQVMRMFLWTNGLCVSALCYLQNEQMSAANTESLTPDPVSPGGVTGRSNNQTERRCLRQEPKWCQADYQEDDQKEE